MKTVSCLLITSLILTGILFSSCLKTDHNQGRVTNIFTGAPIPGVLVTMVSLDGSKLIDGKPMIITSAKTDEQGYYRLNYKRPYRNNNLYAVNIDPSTCTIQDTTSDQERVFYQGILTNSNPQTVVSDNAILNFSLAPGVRVKIIPEFRDVMTKDEQLGVDCVVPGGGGSIFFYRGTWNVPPTRYTLVPVNKDTITLNLWSIKNGNKKSITKSIHVKPFSKITERVIFE